MSQAIIEQCLDALLTAILNARVGGEIRRTSRTAGGISAILADATADVLKARVERPEAYGDHIAEIDDVLRRMEELRRRIVSRP